METIKWISPKDIERLLSKIANSRDKALFGLTYLYGLRRVEAASLTIDDVRLADSRIYIHAAKGGISGEYVLVPQAKRLLMAYLKERGTQPGALFQSRKHNGGIGALSTTQISRLFREYAIRAKLPTDKQHPHVLRHSIAVHMADSGTAQEVVKLHLRHRRMSSTEVYFQITNQRRHALQAHALEGACVARV